VFDAIVLTGAVAGLLQLAIGGTLGGARHSALALLVPGLLGLAVAVVGSRLLPAICRALFNRTRTSGTLGPFLAVRHIARRPGGTRTTMILGTAIALATFSLASWSTADRNRTRVADVTIGAPAVITVAPTIGTSLADVVDKIDPSGHEASAVLRFDSGSDVLLAVEEERFARVAHWSAASVGDPAALLAGLHPAATDPVVIDGDSVRVHLQTHDLVPVGAAMSFDIVATGGTSPTPVSLGTIDAKSGNVTLTGSAAGCPCLLRDVQLTPAAGTATPMKGTVTIRKVESRSDSGWHEVDGATDAQRWVDAEDQRVQITTDPDGMHWRFFSPVRNPPTLTLHDRPDPLPAVVANARAGGNAVIHTTGLDSHELVVSAVQTPDIIPSAASTGVIVDITYASRAAYNNISPAAAQVWVRGDVDRIKSGLHDAHVPILSTETSGSLDEELGRQGPGLASVLFVADAAAAAILAALAAVLSLSAAARRRRYEYAALAATGASSRTLFTALLIEQLVVVGFGVVVGIGAGLAATVLAGGSVPQFVVPQPEPLLGNMPSIWLMVATLGVGYVLVLGSAVLAAAALLRSVTPEQLREAPT
jgi:hypothetical protein